MEIYLVYRYFSEMNDSCVIAAFVNEVDAMKFKEVLEARQVLCLMNE